MNLVSLLFVLEFPVPSYKILWDAFSGFARIVNRYILIPWYNILRVVSLFYMLYNTIDCIFVIGIAVRARSSYLFLWTLVA